MKFFMVDASEEEMQELSPAFPGPEALWSEFQRMRRDIDRLFEWQDRFGSEWAQTIMELDPEWTKSRNREGASDD